MDSVIELDKKRQLEFQFESSEKSSPIETDKKADELSKNTGTVKVDSYFKFERFNQSSNYQHVTNWRDKLMGREYVFESKADKTKIHVRDSKITFNNTEKNYQAVLDIAQDKGWKAIKIKGRNSVAKSELWFQAHMRGIETKGYKPTKADLQRLEGAKSREKSEGLDIQPKKQLQAENQLVKGLSDQEVFMRQMKAVVVEAGRVMDLDDKQINVLENSIMEQLAQAKTQGKSINHKTLPENLQQVQKNLPLFREAFEKSVQMEQNLVKQRQARQPGQLQQAKQRGADTPVVKTAENERNQHTR